MSIQETPLAIPELNPGNSVRFGTDGWRAIIGEDFNTITLARVADATARVYREDNPLSATSSVAPAPEAALGAPGRALSPKAPLEQGNAPAPAAPASPHPAAPAAAPGQAPAPNTIYIGYDCRENAGRYAALMGAVMAGHGFKIRISNSYCPTPALCWTVAHDESAAGGIMLTSSHNPAEYLGVKLRMADGGASPKAFSDRVEAAMLPSPPAAYEAALAIAEAAANGSPSARAQAIPEAPQLDFCDIMGPYLKSVAALVDAEAIRAAGLSVVVDPLFGAGRSYLANLLASMGVTVDEVNNAADPSFEGIHPEPILPWINRGLERTVELGYDACLITDGDADRIGAGDAQGNFVNPHRILALIVAHLVEGKGQSGRVVRTLSGSNLVKRQCERLGLPLTTTPIGFKWIYEEMLAGDVLIGGEESGGIGLPSHVRERDGLLMALLLCELMAKTGKKLGELVADLLASLGSLEFARRDLRLTDEAKAAFLCNHANAPTGADDYSALFAPLGEQIATADHRDGLRIDLVSDAWLLMRPSGTEPLVRVYAEAGTASRVEELLDIGEGIATGHKPC